MMTAVFLALAASATARPIEKKVAAMPPVERGPATAKRVIVEFTDFGCKYCAKAALTVDQLRAKYGDDLKIVFKPVALRIATYPDSTTATRFFLAATLQSADKAWSFHDALFAHQEFVANESFLRKAAMIAGLDFERLKADAEGPAIGARTASDLADFKAAGLTGVPVFLIGESTIQGAQPIETFDAALGGAPAATPEKSAPARAWYDDAPAKNDLKEEK